MNITTDLIVSVVAPLYSTTPDIIRSKTKTDDIKDARHLSRYLIKKLLPSMSLQQIAGATSHNSEHTKVIHSLRFVAEQISKGELIKVKYRQALTILGFPMEDKVSIKSDGHTEIEAMISRREVVIRQGSSYVSMDKQGIEQLYLATL